MSSRKQPAAEITKAPIDCDALFSDSKLYQVSFENSKKKRSRGIGPVNSPTITLLKHTKDSF